MKRIHIVSSLLLVATIAAGCAVSPTEARKMDAARPLFDGRGNGGRAVTPPDSVGARADSTSAVSSPTVTGGGYAGNGG